MPTHLPIDVAQRALRGEICTQCFLRPAGSEKLDAATPRSCEPNCQIFINLPSLMLITHEVHAPTLGQYDRAIENRICQHCEQSETAGDYCANRDDESCPLARYEGNVIDILERLEKARHAGKPAS